MKNSVDFLLQTLRSPTFYRWTNLSYAQEGEDMVLANYFAGRENGFYVDIGAYHPVLYSNTYYFYKRGWCGLNIDARPGSMRMFNKVRPRDINIEAAVSDVKQELTYHMFKDKALNSFFDDSNSATESAKRELVDTKVILTKPLTEILHKHLSPKQHIDFMSIDVEGLDLKVLQSHDWQTWMPDIVLVEDRIFSMDAPSHSEVYTFLKSIQYDFIAKTMRTVFYKKNNRNG